MSDVLVGPGLLSDDARPPPGRTLGDGRHPIAASESGYGVIYVEPEGLAPRLALRTFTENGAPVCFDASAEICNEDTTVGEGATPVVDAHPVVAEYPEGEYAADEYMVAFTEFGGDGDGLGVGAQHVVAGRETQDAVFFMNQTTVGAQYDPDLIWAGDRFVVAYVDTSNLYTAPDLRLRDFVDDLNSDEELLAGTTAAEFNVALAPVTDGYAAAWRESADQKETVRVRLFRDGEETEWSITPAFLAPDSADRPAVIELDESHLLLVYTDARVDATGTSHIGRVRYAILDVDAPGTVSGKNLAAKAPGYKGDLTISFGRANAIRIADEFFVSWTSDRIVGDSRGEEVWLKPVSWSPGATVLGQGNVEQPLPRESWHREGDQRSAALASMPYNNDHALACAWDDRGRTFGAVSGAPDVVAELIPMPMFRNDALLEVDE